MSALRYQVTCDGGRESCRGAYGRHYHTVLVDLGPATPISRGQAPGGRIVRGAPGSNTEHHRTAEHRRVVQRVEVCE